MYDIMRAIDSLLVIGSVRLDLFGDWLDPHEEKELYQLRDKLSALV